MSFPYRAPLSEWRFALFDVFHFSHVQSALTEPVLTEPVLTEPEVLAVAAEFAHFCESVLNPLNAAGDHSGCQFADGRVTAPPGFKAAYAQLVASGWPRQSAPGGALPESLVLLLGEFMGSANWAFAMYPGLSQAALRTLARYAPTDLKARLLPGLVSGRVTGTMCLTEPQSGTDLGAINTWAAPDSEAGYRISGHKLFISAGAHDLADGIVHIVLARRLGAPPGAKGLSLFAVPAGPEVICTGIEHKLGIRANPACALTFQAAPGYLLGEPEQGLAAMFYCMNRARLGTALQGLCHAQVALDCARRYCAERLQVPAAAGQLPLTLAPDIQRMLRLQGALTGGARLLLVRAALLLDAPPENQDSAALLSLLTPLAKAFVTETGLEASSLGLQCLGGYGYSESLPLAQNLRDCRVATLYEGASGIQALDLLGRQILRGEGRGLKLWLAELGAIAAAAPRRQAWRLRRELAGWRLCSLRLALRARKSPASVGAAAFDYLMMAGYISLAGLWLKAAGAARAKLAAGHGDAELLNGQLDLCAFYFTYVLPRAALHRTAALAAP